MSLNRDKESNKEIANKRADFIAKAKDFNVALTPEKMIEKIVEKEKIVEVMIDDPELREEINKVTVNLQEANDLLEFKDDQIKTLAERLEKATKQFAEDAEDYAAGFKTFEREKDAADKALAEYKESKAESAKIIKGLESKNLKLKEAVKQLSE